MPADRRQRRRSRRRATTSHAGDAASQSSAPCIPVVLRRAGRGSGIPDINAPGGSSLTLHSHSKAATSTIRGIVQGVGFRPWVYRLAVIARPGRLGAQRRGGRHHRGLRPGAPRRLRAAPPGALPRRRRASPASRAAPSRDRPRLRRSRSSRRSRPADRRVSIPADLADLPRLPARRSATRPTGATGTPSPTARTAARASPSRSTCPYDRPNTTMAPFVMCAACQAEYDSPAGPPLPRAAERVPGVRPAVCGSPTPDGRELASRRPDRRGRGAASPAGDRRRQGPRRLPPRVRRDQRRRRRRAPAAQAARREAVRRDGRGPRRPPTARRSDADERPLLLSLERPIVLAGGAAGAALAPNVAPGNPLVGVMLPYTPLHHLLLAAAGRPLVMTSGNLSDEPLAYRNDEAVGTARPASPTSCCCTTATSTRAATTRWPASSPARRSCSAARAATCPAAFAVARFVRAAGARLRRAAEEHVLPRHRRHRVPRAAHRRPREPRDLRGLRARHRAHGALRRRARRPSSRTTCTPTTSRRATRSTRPEPLKVAVQHHHAHVVGRHGRARRRRARHRRRLRRHGARHRRHGVGRRDSGGRRHPLRRASAPSDRFASPAAISRSARSGARRSRCSTTRSGAMRRSNAFRSSAPSRPARSPSCAPMLASRVNAPSAHGVGRYFDAVGALALGKAESRSRARSPWSGTLRPIRTKMGGTSSRSPDGPAPFEVDLRPAVRALAGDLHGGGLAGPRVGAVSQHARGGDGGAGRRWPGAARAAAGRAERRRVPERAAGRAGAPGRSGRTRGGAATRRCRPATAASRSGRRSSRTRSCWRGGWTCGRDTCA